MPEAKFTESLDVFKHLEAGEDSVNGVLIDSDTRNAHVFTTQAVFKSSKKNWQGLKIPQDKQFFVSSVIHSMLDEMINTVYQFSRSQKFLVDQAEERIELWKQVLEHATPKEGYYFNEHGVFEIPKPLFEVGQTTFEDPLLTDCKKRKHEDGV